MKPIDLENAKKTPIIWARIVNAQTDYIHQNQENYLELHTQDADVVYPVRYPTIGRINVKILDVVL
jgi:hypothetical protein